MPWPADAPLAGRRLLIFDLDGTVADTAPAHEAAFNATLAPYGITVDYPAIAGLRTEEAVEQVLAAHGVTILPDRRTELVLAKRLAAREALGKVAALPGALEFIAWAEPRFRLAMVSSGSDKTVRAVLTALGLPETFDPLVTGDDVARPKPDPEPFLTCLALAEFPAEQALVFEDADAGIASAQGAGIATIRIGDGASDWRDLLAAAR
jgi:HAD superfamily hydrolase (TIGR01509 family)